MKSVTVNTSTPYDVLIEKGCLSRCGEFAAKLFVPQKSTAAIITDDRVSSLYLKTVSDSFQKAGFSVCSFVFPNGEDSKSHDTLLQVYDFLIQNNITRTDFMRLAEISRNKAIELLNKFLKEEIIRKYGGGKTVVYLKE